MMLERADLIFRDVLARWLAFQLRGDEKQDGLYRTILSSQDWDTFNRTKGMIQGYENVLKAMDDVVQRMNADEERAGRAMN